MLQGLGPVGHTIDLRYQHHKHELTSASSKYPVLVDGGEKVDIFFFHGGGRPDVIQGGLREVQPAAKGGQGVVVQAQAVGHPCTPVLAGTQALQLIVRGAA